MKLRSGLLVLLAALLAGLPVAFSTAEEPAGTLDGSEPPAQPEATEQPVADPVGILFDSVIDSSSCGSSTESTAAKDTQDIPASCHCNNNADCIAICFPYQGRCIIGGCENKPKKGNCI